MMLPEATAATPERMAVQPAVLVPEPDDKPAGYSGQAEEKEDILKVCYGLRDTLFFLIYFLIDKKYHIVSVPAR